MMAKQSERKDKVQIYVTPDYDFNKLVEKVARLFEDEGHTFKTFGAARYTISEVVLKALEALADEYDTKPKK